MTTDLLFMPTLPQKPPFGRQPDKSGIVSREPASKNESPDSAHGAEHENFLTFLRRMSQDRHRSEGSPRQTLAAADRMDKTERFSVNAHRGDNEPVSDDETLLNDETQLAAILNQLMTLFEKLDLKISSGEGSAADGTQRAQSHMFHPAGKALENLSALKQLLGAIQSNGLRLGHAAAPGLERLQQLIAQAMGAEPSSQDESGLKNGFNPAQQHTDMISSAASGEGAGAEKAAEILSALPAGSSDADSAPKASKAAKPVNGDASELAGKAGDSRDNGDPNPLASTADKKHRLGGEALVENTLTGQSSPVSKSINDPGVEKENPLKANLAAGDDLDSKVVKLEAGTNDSGQLASQSQTFEKTLESTYLAKEAGMSSRELRTQTMEQIVRRAVIQVRDGQHEARIDLKPDFMGQVRMQVSTINHQVTIKILTEFGFVKDMIENNIHQLKAELQQHGLEVDKVDVTVSRDSEGNKHPQENTGHAGSRQRGADSSDRGNEREGQPERPKRSFQRAEGHATVDFFA